MSIQDFSSIWAPWKIGEVLGKGSFGTVYKITKDELGEKYVSALKHISIPMDEQQKEELYAEGIVTSNKIADYYRQIMYELREEIVTTYTLKGNTNIVSYEDHKIIPKKDGIGYDIFIKMEYLTSLSTILAKGGMTKKEIVKLGIDMCRALETLEKEKIIHRDIKPSNIFVNAKGEFKLGDFGVARHLNNNACGLSVKGTYKYMAPEIFKGENVNFTVDIYSLGLVMYVLLNNNRSPFVSTTSEMISYEEAERANYKRMRGEKLPKPLNADSKLSGIILKACEYNPASRWQNARDFRMALEKYQSSSAYSKLDDSKQVFIPTPIPSKSSRVGSMKSTQKLEASGSIKQQPAVDIAQRNKKNKTIILIAAISACLLFLSILGVIVGKTLADKKNEPTTTTTTTTEATTKTTTEKTTKKTTESTTKTTKSTTETTTKDNDDYEYYRTTTEPGTYTTKRYYTTATTTTTRTTTSPPLPDESPQGGSFDDGGFEIIVDQNDNVW